MIENDNSFISTNDESLKEQNSSSKQSNNVNEYDYELIEEEARKWFKNEYEDTETEAKNKAKSNIDTASEIEKNAKSEIADKYNVDALLEEVKKSQNFKKLKGKARDRYIMDAMNGEIKKIDKEREGLKKTMRTSRDGDKDAYDTYKMFGKICKSIYTTYKTTQLKICAKLPELDRKKDEIKKKFLNLQKELNTLDQAEKAEKALKKSKDLNFKSFYSETKKKIKELYSGKEYKNIFDNKLDKYDSNKNYYFIIRNNEERLSKIQNDIKERKNNLLKAISTESLVNNKQKDILLVVYKLYVDQEQQSINEYNERIKKCKQMLEEGERREKDRERANGSQKFGLISSFKNLFKKNKNTSQVVNLDDSRSMKCQTR